MYTEKCDSMTKKTLKSLCCSNGWCYAIFWGFDQINSLLLTVKDAYYEEQMGALIDTMLQQEHVVGGGVIGQTAFMKNHRWMYSDAYHEMPNSLGSFDSLEVFQEGSEFFCQFSVGIKTIAVISVEPWGVLQLGSTHKNPETKDFVKQVKELFREMDRCPKIETSDSQFYNSSEQLSSVLLGRTSHSVDQNKKHGAFSEGFMEANHSSVLPPQSFPAASLIEYPFQIGSKSTNQLEELLLESNNFFDSSASQALSSHSDCSLLTSSLPHCESGYDESCRNSSLIGPVNHRSTSQSSKDMLTNQHCNSLLDPTDCKAQRPYGLSTFEEFFQESNLAEAIMKPGLEDDFSQWFSPQTDAFHAAGLVQVSSLSRDNTPDHKSENLPTNSMQSSVTHAFRSSNEVKCPGMEKLLDTFGVERGMKKLMGWDETLIPVVNGDDLKFSAEASECSFSKHVGSKMCTSNSLFSKLGLDELLDGVTTTSPCSFSKSRFEDQSSSATKRRKIDNFSWIHNQVKFEGLPSFDRKMKSLNPAYDTETKNIGLNTEDSTKETRSCIADSCIIDAGKTSSSRREDEPAKTRKKKAKPGTRPRPKDRQMIQDRLAELRELIPNGEKMSIDRLLERTIRHMNFMQSLTKNAESLKQIDKPKSRELQKICSTSGVTWACEVGDQTMVCPLIVEDLSTPGQMLIEILCEEDGFFLEIVDIIRGFGLIILKGVMEVRETKKIWAHFMVEAEGTRCVTRHEIFSSLIQLLQMTGQSAVSANDTYGNVISSGMPPAFNNYQPSGLFPVNVADALHCASL